MAGLVPAIYVLAATGEEDVVARDKHGHDGCVCGVCVSNLDCASAVQSERRFVSQFVMAGLDPAIHVLAVENVIARVDSAKQS
jgi:hypothetical protein